jgi:hypothetical protein
MRLRLDELHEAALDLGFESVRVDASRVDVTLYPGCVLVFWNLPEDDSLIGFQDTQWHTHDTLGLSTGNGTFIECDELDVLAGLSTGEILIITELRDGVIRDRWLEHKLEPLSLRYLGPGDELRVQRAPSPSAKRSR